MDLIAKVGLGLIMHVYTFVPSSNINNLVTHCSAVFAFYCRQLRNDSNGKDTSEAHTWNLHNYPSFSPVLMIKRVLAGHFSFTPESPTLLSHKDTVQSGYFGATSRIESCQNKCFPSRFHTYT